MTTSSPCSAANPSGPGAAGRPAGHGAFVIHPGALGDVLLAIPALRVLRAARPSEPVVLAAEPRLATLLRDLGEADGALALDALGVRALFAGEDLPCASALHGARRIVSFLGARDPAFVARLGAVAPRVDVASSAASDRPVWQHLVRTVDPCADPPLTAVSVPASLRARGAALLADAGWREPARLAIVHPGAGGEAKRWSARKFARVIEMLVERGLTVAIHAGPVDGGAVAAVTAAVRVAVLTLHEPPLAVLAGALTSAAIYLGNDSGVSHLAAAVGTPSVILFTEAGRAWRPWSVAPCLVPIEPSRPDAADLDPVLASVAALLGDA